MSLLRIRVEISWVNETLTLLDWLTPTPNNLGFCVVSLPLFLCMVLSEV
jgi:hypothetical protein